MCNDVLIIDRAGKQKCGNGKFDIVNYISHGKPSFSSFSFFKKEMPGLENTITIQQDSVKCRLLHFVGRF